MPNSFFQFKQFIIHQDRSAMKVTTDACLFGAWVAKEISDFKFLRKESFGQISDLLDIGTGTGLLSLMIAQKNNVTIDAVEIDKDAAEQAKENVGSSEWKNTINVINSDILELPDDDKKYDVIVSNPPFYEREIISQQQKKNVAHHSHELKLAELVDIIKNKLAENGNFFLLLPAKREREIELLLNKNKLFLQKKIIVHQSTEHDVFRIMLQGSKQKTSEVEVKKISITDDQRKYAQEFIDLLKDYYLHL